jgi:hypothetical protein
MRRVPGVGRAAGALGRLAHGRVALVGLLAKLLAVLAFAIAAIPNALPWRGGVAILPNDLVWLVPSALMLVAAWRSHHSIVATRADAHRSRRRA